MLISEACFKKSQTFLVQPVSLELFFAQYCRDSEYGRRDGAWYCVYACGVGEGAGQCDLNSCEIRKKNHWPVSYESQHMRESSEQRGDGI